MPANNTKKKIANPAMAKKDNLFLPLQFCQLQVLEKQHNSTGNENRRICANYNADKQ